MAAALDALGFISGLAGLAQLFTSQFNPPDSASGTGVVVKLGLANDTNTGQGGTIEQAYCFDYTNSYLGSGPGGDNVPAGEIIGMTCDQSEPDRQGRFISITAGDDDVCILLVTVNNQDGLYTGSWNGDIGWHCGQGWYHGGGEPIGKFNDTGEPFAPHCSWFGPNVPMHGAVSYSWKFNSLAYSAETSSTIQQDTICDATIYSADKGAISDKPAGVDTADKKRSITSLDLPSVRPAWMEHTLVISKVASQTADELCNHGMSWGPDFVDVHGSYCDMKTKTLFTLCTSSVSVGCVSLSANDTVISKRSNLAYLARRTPDVVHKSYRSVRRWGGQ